MQHAHQLHNKIRRDNKTKAVRGFGHALGLVDSEGLFCTKSVGSVTLFSWSPLLQRFIVTPNPHNLQTGYEPNALFLLCRDLLDLLIGRAGRHLKPWISDVAGHPLVFLPERKLRFERL